jgi:hypothetical protein
VDERQARHIDSVERAAEPSGTVRLALEVSDSEETARRLTGHADVGTVVATPWGDRNVRVRTPEGIQLTLFTPPAEAEV